MFTGGALLNGALFALGIMPYISASIIMQLMGAVFPHLARLQQEGEPGRQKISQYTRYLTILICLVQGGLLAVALRDSPGSLIMGFNPAEIGLDGQPLGNIVVASSPSLFLINSIVFLTTGSLILMWLGEQITARGIGNGISLIIFVGIIAELPAALAQFFASGRSGAISPAVIVGVIVMVVAVIAFVVFMERALRKVLIQYPRRQVGMKVMEGQNSHLPIKVNPAGVIPAIFASSLLLLPTTISTFSGGGGSDAMSTILAYFGPGQPAYLAFFTLMIVFFAFFYTHNVSFKVDDVADNLKNQNGFIPGIRPGKKTAEHLEYVVNRVLVLGSAYLAAVCLLPEILRGQLAIPFYFGGTSLLIVVSVTMDTIQQVQSHLLAHQYESLIQKSKLRGKAKTRNRKGPARR